MHRLTVVTAALLAAVAFVAASVGAAPGTAGDDATGRYIVIAGDAAGFRAALDAATRSPGRVALELTPVNAFAINATQDVAQALARMGVKVVPDRIEHLVRPALREELGWNDPAKVKPSDLRDRPVAAKNRGAISSGFTPDPAFALGPPSPMWSIERLDAATAWATNGGDSDVLVAVADTGLDYTHDELASRVVSIQDLTTTEEPKICKDILGYGFDDADLAADLGAPAAPDNDFNGHGSWIGGNIAGAVDAAGVNGIAPGVSLVGLKISQWCGSAYDSEMLGAFVWAAEHGVDVVNMSFGGYLDRTDPYQDALWDLYVAVVKYANLAGTTIVSSAGNDHVRISKTGQVISHGILDVPPGGTDYFGLWEIPAGVPGVVAVSSTGNVVNAASASCPGASAGSPTEARAWCKPTSDVHQPIGVGLTNQLAYYSNYGPRIDVAGPGGARKFNLPSIDRGGTEGWPFTGIDSYVSDNSPGGNVSETDGYNAWEDFSITSNFAIEIPCVIFDGTSADPDPDGYYGVPTRAGFANDQCYSAIQGTSMSSPHAAGVLALIASAWPALRYDPAALLAYLKKSGVTPTKSLRNFTPGMSRKDTTGGDRTGGTCPGAYCHLGGRAISRKDAYGAGLVNAAKAVAGGLSGT